MITSFISPHIEGQFPDLYKQEGPAFIAFVKAYYEWLESSDQVVSDSRNLLSYRDIDTTLDKFIESFRFKYLDGLTGDTKVKDRRLLLKHIRELYASKGTKRGLELLFRIIFDADTELYFPADNILRPSDGDYVIPQYAEITYTPNNYLLVGENISGRLSGATAYVEDIKTIFHEKRRTDILQLANVVGVFQADELLFSSVIPNIGAPRLVGSLSDVENFGVSFGYRVGDVLDIADGSGFGAKAVVTRVSPRDGTLFFTIIDGGSGYSVEFSTLELQQLPGSTGSGAQVRVGSLRDTEEHLVCLNTIASQLVPAMFVGNIDDFYYTYTTPDVHVHSVRVDNISGFRQQGNVYVSNTTANTFAKLLLVKSAPVVDTPVSNNITVTAGSKTVALANGSQTYDFTPLANSTIRIEPGYFFEVESGNTTAMVLRTTPTVTLANSAWSVRGSANLMVFGLQSNAAFEPTVGSVIQYTVAGNTYSANVVSIGTELVPADFLSMDRLRWKSNVQIETDPYFIATVPGQISFYIDTADAGDFPVGTLVKVGNTTANVEGTVIYNLSAANTVNSTTGDFSDTQACLIALEPVANVSFDVSDNHTLWLSSDMTTNSAVVSDYTQSQTPLDQLLDIRNITIGTIASLEIVSQGSGYTGAVSVVARDDVIGGENMDDGRGGIKGLNADIEARAGSGQGAVDAVRILDTGYGYKAGDVITLTNPANANTLIGTVIASRHGYSEGRFVNNNGFLSDTQYIQDNDYYQEFSYVIQTEMSLNKYAQIVRNLWHPAGTKMFGAGLFVDVGDARFEEADYIRFDFADADASLVVGDYVTSPETNGIGIVIQTDGTNHKIRAVGTSLFVANSTLTNMSSGTQVATITSVTSTLVEDDEATTLL